MKLLNSMIGKNSPLDRMRKRNRPAVRSRSSLPKTAAAAFEIFSAVLPSFEHIEYAYVMLLNRSNRLLGVKQLSMGGISGTVIDPKIVFQTALKANASCIILAHNHPSGEIVPSEQDNSLTSKLKSAGEFLDLPLLDHLILTQDKYFSYKDEGRIL